MGLWNTTLQGGGLGDAEVLVGVLLDAVPPLPPHHDPVLKLLQQVVVEQLQELGVLLQSQACTCQSCA